MYVRMYVWCFVVNNYVCAYGGLVMTWYSPSTENDYKIKIQLIF